MKISYGLGLLTEYALSQDLSAERPLKMELDFGVQVGRSSKIDGSC